MCTIKARGGGDGGFRAVYMHKFLLTLSPYYVLAIPELMLLLEY